MCSWNRPGLPILWARNLNVAIVAAPSVEPLVEIVGVSEATDQNDMLQQFAATLIISLTESERNGKQAV
jgi:hypothetical protein